MDALRRELDTYNTDEMSQNVAAQARTDVAYRRATVLAGAGLGTLILVTALGTGYLVRGVVGPVRRNAHMAGRLAGGDLAARVPDTGVGEIGALERAFNAMAESLQRKTDELARLNDEQAALRRIATLVGRGGPSSELFSAVTMEVGVLLGAEITRLIRFEADGGGTVAAAWSRTGDELPIGSRISLNGVVAAPVRESGEPARMTEQSPPELPAGSYSAVGTPITVGGALWGAITALSAQDRPLPDGSETRMAEFTDLVGTAIANAQDRADLVSSRARIVTAADDARRRLERDLHDGAQQRLVSLGLQARTAQQCAPAELGDLQQDLAQLVSGLTDASLELREISRGLHPGILSEGGLGAALKALARRSHFPISVDVQIQQQVPDAVEVAAYYVAAEALTNAAKHAHASEVRVRAEARDDVLYLSIDDDGMGGADYRHGTGLVGLKDRVEAFGGHMSLISQVGAGTSISISIPLPD
jgi:signal transduction histidine kinase